MKTPIKTAIKNQAGYKSKKLKEVLPQEAFVKEAYIEMVLDQEFGTMAPIRKIYSANGLAPEESNIVWLIQNQDFKDTQKTWLQKLLKKTTKSEERYQVWQKILENSPISFSSSEEFLDYLVPNSLIGIIEKALKPLDDQLNSDRNYLAAQPEKSSFKSEILKYLCQTVAVLGHLLKHGSIPTLVPQKFEHSSHLDAVNNAYVETKRYFKTDCTDAILVDYLALFLNTDTFIHKIHIGNNRYLIQLLKADGKTKKEIIEFFNPYFSQSADL